MTKIRYLRYVVIIVLAIFILGRVYYRATDDFRIGNITHKMPFQEKWKTNELSPEEKNLFDAIASQNFTYLGKGAQSYAFVSEDGKYVIKFFKFKHLRPYFLLNIVPGIGPLKDWKEAKLAEKREKLDNVFSGYKLAYDVHKQGTGLVFIHLNQTNHLNKNVSVTDKIGMKHSIALDDVIFVIQERAETSRKIIINLLNQGKVEEALAKIHRIFDLYLSEYDKGIYDHDHGVMHNTGFVGDRPIHIDVGKLHVDPRIKDPDFMFLDFCKVAYKVDQNVQNSASDHLPDVRLDIEQYVSNMFGRNLSLETFDAEAAWKIR